MHGDNPSTTLRAGLGSASLTTNASGGVVSQNRYYPFGASRFTQGTRPTDVDFTGQRLDGTGLHFYNARYYANGLGRFVQPDNIVPEPGSSKGFNRYAYAYNNPLKFIDPSGHCGAVAGTVGNLDCTYQDFENMSLQDRTAWIQALMKEPKLADWFNNIASVMQAYIDLGMGNQANWNTSWLGLTNAGILLSIHDGYAAFQSQQGGGTPTQGESGNAGSLWKGFFDAQKATPNDSGLAGMWGDAEAAGTQYGINQAAARGKYPGLGETAFLTMGDWYREGSLPTKSGAIGLGLGAPIGGMIGFVVCGPPCALAGALIGGAGGGGAGYAYANSAEDPRATLGPIPTHPVYPFARGFLTWPWR